MNKTSKRLLACCALLACAPIVARASPPKSVENESGWLTVLAPRVFRRAAEGISARSTAELVSIVHRVSYAGLDLAMHADVLELQKRIDESARNGCEQLAALSPLADLDTATCVREAVEDASARAHELVASAMAAHETE